jgi:hypothetical protein
MRKLVIAAVSVAGVLGAATALAADGDQSVEAIALKDPNRIVCAFIYNQGDIVRRICQTARYWANEHTRTRRELLEYQLRRLEPGR